MEGKPKVNQFVQYSFRKYSYLLKNYSCSLLYRPKLLLLTYLRLGLLIATLKAVGSSATIDKCPDLPNLLYINVL